MNRTSEVRSPVLRLADTKLVLGNICAETVFNGRSIGDFATLLAIAGTSLGATRALYRLLETAGDEFAWLERGRDVTEIASSDLLDAPPESWADLMVVIFLAEAASSAIAHRLESDSDRLLVNQARMISRDSAFHMAYCLGWLKVISEKEHDAVKVSVEVRLPLALRWVEQCIDGAREHFISSIADLVSLAGVTVPTSQTVPTGWNRALGRAESLPASLWKIVQFKDPELVR